MSESRFEETPERPWGSRPDPGQGGPEGPPHPVREPLFNAPWQAVAVTALIVGGYFLQTQLSAEALTRALAFSPANLTPQRWETAITAIFLHGNWAHALMNAAFALAFST